MLRNATDSATHKAKQLGQNRVSFRSPSLKRRDRLDDRLTAASGRGARTIAVADSGDDPIFQRDALRQLFP